MAVNSDIVVNGDIKYNDDGIKIYEMYWFMDKLYISTLNKGNQNDICLVRHLMVIPS